MRCTGSVKRVVVAAVAIAALVTLPACGSKKPTDAAPATSAPTLAASGSVSAPPSAAPSGSPTAAPGVEFTVDGAGPYQIGDMLTDLKTTPGLANVASDKTCPNNTTAQGTGTWTGVQFSFHQDGVLYLAVNRSPSIPTPSGAWLGTGLAQLKTIYAQVQTEQLTAGKTQAFLVTTLSGRGILFNLNAQGAVTSMVAGDGAFLKTSFQNATNFC